MWTVVYIAPNRKIALMLKNLLEFEGILVNLKGTNAAGDDQNIEIMVSDLEIEEANEVINNALMH
jgi:hypothetical protein